MPSWACPKCNWPDPGLGRHAARPAPDGPASAIDLMLSGRHLGARRAWRPACSIASATAPARRRPAWPTPRNCWPAPACAAPATAAGRHRKRPRDAQDIKADTASKTRGLFSPLKIVEAVEAGLDLPFEEALRNERQLFLQCIDSPQRAGLIHAFFAEREVAKAPETRNAQPRQIALRGRGRRHHGRRHRGGGARCRPAGDHGGARRSLHRAGRANVAKVYDGLVAKGRMTAAGKDQVLSRFQGSTLRRPRQRRPRHRGGVRGPGREEGRVRRARPRLQAGRRDRHQHFYLDIDAIAASISGRRT